MSELWTAMSNLLGTSLNPTTAYHPQANGLVERNHRDLKAALKCRLEDHGVNWVDQLPWVLLGLRTVPKEDLNASSAELLYGRQLAVPGDFFPDSKPMSPSRELQRQRDRLGSLRPMPTSAHGEEKSHRPHMPQALESAKFVFVRRDAHKTPLQNQYEGPFEVVEQAPKHFVLRYGNRQDSVSIDRLKPAYLDQTQPPQTALPPRRGRPPVSRPPPDEQPEPPTPWTEVVARPRRRPPGRPLGSRNQTKPQPVTPTAPAYRGVTTRSGRMSKLPQRLQPRRRPA